MEVQYECECGQVIPFSVSPIIPGRYSGPPELCYPDEGGEIDGPENCPNCGEIVDTDFVYELAADQDSIDEPDLDFE